MSDNPKDRLAEAFDQLQPLDENERTALLADMRLTATERAEVQALLDADSREHDPFAVIGRAAQRLFDEQLVRAPLALGPWRLLREIGSGGMGTVFLAERSDGAFAQQVAIKLMRGFPTEEGRRRLRLERQLLAQLDHPGIARLIDGGETDDGQPYLVLEYVDGEPITHFAATHQLALAARLALFDQVCAAVAHAHQQLIIHRDIKPSNVFVRSDGVPKLLDFGIAKLLEPDAVETTTRAWTPGYASPEQRTGRGVGSRSDVYALGILLRELLSGIGPDGQPLKPALDAVKMDQELRGIIDKASSESMNERYATVEALREDLRCWREGRPVSAAADTAWYRARKFLKRHRAAAALGLLALVATAAFVGLLANERNRALQAEAVADEKRALAERSASMARRSLSFLSGVMADSTPDRTGGKAITVDDLIARAESRLSRETGSQAAVLRGFVGKLYRNIGDNRRAVPLLRDALDAMRSEGLRLDDEYADIAMALASSSFSSGDRKAAAAAARDAADVWQQLSGAMAASHHLSALGYAAFAEGDMAAAANWFRQSMASFPTNGPLDDYADQANMLVATLNLDGHFHEADVQARRALSRLKESGEQRSLMTQALLRTHSQVLGKLGRMGEALQSVDASIEIYQSMYGNRGREYGALMNDRGIVLNGIGRYREARQAYEAAYAINAAPIAKTNIAGVDVARGDYAGALKIVRALISGPEFAKLLPQHQRITQARLGQALSYAGDHVAAEAVLRRLLEELKEIGQSDGAERANVYLHLARNALFARHWDEARLSVESARSAFGAQITPAAVATLDNLLGAAALGNGKLDDAAQLMKRSYDAILRNEGGDSLQAAIAGIELAEVELARGQRTEAQALLEEHAARVLQAELLPGARVRRQLAQIEHRLRTSVNGDTYGRLLSTPDLLLVFDPSPRTWVNTAPSR